MFRSQWIDGDTCSDYLHEKAADAIEKLSHATPRWIPVTERLPEPGGYLVCKKHDYGYGVHYSLQIVSYTDNLNKIDKYDFPGKKNKRPGWFDYDSEYGHFETGNDIFAWMPLQAPPKEDE